MEKDNSSQKTAPQNIKRLTIGLNVLVQVLVFTAIAAMVNYVSFRHFKRWDFSRNQKYALAELTKNLLSNLKKPVKAVVFFPSAQGIAQDVGSLLREYEYASDKKVTVEIVDPYRNLLRARELSEKYKFGASDNIVILDYEGKTKFVNAMDMAEMDTSRAMFGQPPTIRSFKGEEAITSALLEITEERQNKAYFVTGHGEPAPTGQDISALKTFLDRQNVRSETLNLSNVDSVPADASAVVILYPRTDLSEREIKLLSDYWGERNGRLMVLLGANINTERLNAWLGENGAKPQQDVVMRTGTMLAVERGQPTLKQGVVNTAIGIAPPASKNVLKELVGMNVQLSGLTQSIAIDQAKASAAKVRVTPLLSSPAEFWGETEYSPQDPQPPTKDPAKDHVGQLTLAVALERGGLEDARVKVDTGRLIVAGNAAFIFNDGLRVSDAGLYFVLNGMNWLINREQISGIPPKSKQAISLSLDETQMGRLALAVMGIIPALVALIGGFIWWKRRSI
jgi:hypothetical protein